MKGKIICILVCTLFIFIALEGVTIAIFETSDSNEFETSFYNKDLTSIKRDGDRDQFELALMSFYPIQVIKGSGVIRPDIWDTSLGNKQGRPDLVEEKKTLIEIWYFLYGAESVETTVTIKIYDSDGVKIKEISEQREFEPTSGDYLKLEPWVPLPSQPFIDEISKPNIEIEVEIGPVSGDIELNNNKLRGRFLVKKSKLNILYTCVGRNNSDLTSALAYITTAEGSREFIEGTFPVPVVKSGVSFIPIIENGAPGELAQERLVFIFLKIALVSLLNGYDRGVGIIKEDWLDDNIQGNWANTAGVCIPSIVGILSEVGRISTPAHEIGHTYGLYVTGPEEYDLVNPGNPTTVYWVAKQNVSPHELQKDGFCFMGFAPPQWNYFLQNTHIWIDTDCYRSLYENITEDPEIIVASGLISEDRGVELYPWYHLPEGYIDVNTEDSGNYTFVYLNEGSQEIGRAGFNAYFNIKGNQSVGVDLTGFAFRIPWLKDTKEIQIRDQDENILTSRSVSENSPVVTVTYPNGGETLIIGNDCNITWDASDQDGDDLTFSISYSNDSGETWIPIDIDIKENYYIWDTQWCTSGNEYLIRVRASDNINVGKDVSDGTFSLINSPPCAPTVSGPITGNPNKEYEFTLNSVDPEDDDVRYHIEWGDGDSEITIYYSSGTDVTVSHTWSEQGSYSISVYAEDEYGGVSDETLHQINIKKSKSINKPFQNWLQNHPNMFPLLRQLLGL